MTGSKMPVSETSVMSVSATSLKPVKLALCTSK